MKEKEYDLRGFKFEDVMDECSKYSSLEEQIDYLVYVEKKWISERPLLDPNGQGKPTFAERIRAEIELRENSSGGRKETATNKIIWMKSRQDFMGIFNALYELGFIPFRKDKHKQLCEHFTWIDGEMTTEHLRQASNNIKNKSETHQLSDEMQRIVNELKDGK